MYKILFTFLIFAFSATLAENSSSQIENEWQIFKDHLKNKIPVYYNRLNPPSTTSQIKHLESKLNLDLPREIKNLYLLNNGEDEEWFNGGVMCGLRMLSIDQIIKEWENLKSLETQFQFNEKWKGKIFPTGAIKAEYFNEKWIPIFSDNNGNYLGIDLAPNSTGTIGQIINFGTDEYNHFVISKSLESFLKFINMKFEDGTIDKAIIQNHKNQNVFYGLKKESHLIDDLTEIVK